MAFLGKLFEAKLAVCLDRCVQTFALRRAEQNRDYGHKKDLTRFNYNIAPTFEGEPRKHSGAIQSDVE